MLAKGAPGDTLKQEPGLHTAAAVEIEPDISPVENARVPPLQSSSLPWRHNGRDGVSNHQLLDGLLNRLFKAQIKEHIKAQRHWPLWGDSPVTGEIPHIGPVTRKMFPFDDVIMYISYGECSSVQLPDTPLRTNYDRGNTLLRRRSQWKIYLATYMSPGLNQQLRCSSLDEPWWRHQMETFSA